MKINDLHKYHALAEMLECVEEQLEHKQVHDAVLGDSGEPAHEQVTKPVEGYIHGIGTVSLLAEKRRIEHDMKLIRAYIAAVPITRIRKALELYCMAEKRYTWAMVADELGEIDDICLRQAVSRYIKHLEQDNADDFGI